MDLVLQLAITLLELGLHCRNSLSPWGLDIHSEKRRGFAQVFPGYGSLEEADLLPDTSGY